MKANMSYSLVLRSDNQANAWGAQIAVINKLHLADYLAEKVSKDEQGEVVIRESQGGAIVSRWVCGQQE